jgi:hypothetical protein
MLQHSQLVGVPAGALVLGLLTSLPYARVLGWPAALGLGGLLGLSLCLLAGWLVYRSDFSARHFVANALLFVLWMAPFLGGMNLALMQLAGAQGWSLAAWALGVVTVLAPVLGPAWQTHAALVAQGDTGPWAAQHVDQRKGLLLPGALTTKDTPQPAITPWQVGALAVNVPLIWRLLGGQQAGLLAGALVLMSGAVVWVGVKQIGPALGKAWFLIDLERRTGVRLRNPALDEIQAVRRGHGLARRFMRDA